MPNKPIPCARCGELLPAGGKYTPSSMHRACRKADTTERGVTRPGGGGSNRGGPNYSKQCSQCGEPGVIARGLCNPHYQSLMYRERKAAGAVRSTYWYTKNCAWCGDEFRTTTKKTTTCSMSCSQWARHYVPTTGTALVHVPAEPKRWTSRFAPVEHPTRTWNVIVNGPCAKCGKPFTNVTTTGEARYCSDRCSKRAGSRRRDAERGRFRVSAIRRLALYERDGWTCAICGGKTSREYAHGDPWSPTLDHIEPQASALIPDHGDANLRTVHVVCNSLRGDARRTDAEVVQELALRGLTGVGR